MRNITCSNLVFSLMPPFIILLSLTTTHAQSPASPPHRNSEGNSTCAKCHSAIVANYNRTAMAHASGAASESPITGSFFHKPSGVGYRVYEDEGSLWLEFRREVDPKIEGKKEMLFYIGSGQLKGRTYLFETKGLLFESPVNWYAQQRFWDMTPNYQNVRETPLNLPAFPECLNCHTSGMQSPSVGTLNHYAKPPFLHGGITCERCHGSSVNHVARGEKMLKLAALPANRRDAICMQCHLEGDVAIERPHVHGYEFKPGDDLSSFVRYFVFANKTGSRAVSQFEALAQSACKRATGDRMTCTTCHDPHSSPDAAKQVDYFRSKCIACHGESFAAKHYSHNPDCVACHMPSLETKDITHTQATDHRILRRPSRLDLANLSDQTRKLEPFPATPETKDDVRELALAYQAVAERGNSFAAQEAERLLQQANQQDPNDAAVLAALGFISQQRAEVDKATRYYEAALHSDPYSEEAAINLGVIEAKAGHLQRSVSLWQPIFERAPWRSSVGIDLALQYCAADRFERAKDYVNRVLEFNPDFAVGHSLLAHLAGNPPRCSWKP